MHHFSIEFYRQHQKIFHFIKLSLFYFLQMVSAMQNTFTYLQKLAAGLEQVVADQAQNNGPFLTEFDRAQYELKTVSYITIFINTNKLLLHNVKS